MTDPLSDVLATLRMRSTLYFRARLGSPWGLGVPRQPHVVRFHVVAGGRCHLRIAGFDTPAVLERGDLALVPHGAKHDLLSKAGVRPAPVGVVLDETAYDGSEDLRYGSPDGEECLLVCGHFAFDDERLHPVFEGLPPLVHLRASEGHDFTWLDAATRSLGRETALRPPGWEAVVDRVAEILFVQALRAQYGRPEAPPSLAAFADPRLSRALAAVHRQPEREWSLEQLATTAGMSRTSFATGFRQAVGMPPMAYVTRWRLQRARRELLDSADTVSAVASRFGFDSEPSFSRAFRRLYGKPPASYRRSRAAA